MIIVKNKRLKMSPSGIVTLPVSARRALGMIPKASAIVSVHTTMEGISISPVNNGESGSKVSPRGNLFLDQRSRAVLAKGIKRHYWLAADDQKRNVILHPFA